MQKSDVFRTLVADLVAQQRVGIFHRDWLHVDATVGVPLGLHEDIVTVATLTEGGTFGGLLSFFMGDVTRVIFEGTEIEAFDSLRERHGIELPGWVSELELGGTVSQVAFELARRAGHVAIHCEGLPSSMTFIGQPLEAGIEFLSLDTYGTYQGRCRQSVLIRLDTISSVGAGEPYVEAVSWLARREPS